MSPLLRVSGVTRRFGGLTAVDAVSFDVEAGSIVGLIGPNGAGKTTVFNLITGHCRADEGDILFQGRSISTLPTHRIVAAGIARTFQSIRLFQPLSVVENVLAGCHCRLTSGSLAAMFRTRAQRMEEWRALESALGELEFVGLLPYAEQRADNLSYGNQRRLEIARALATRPSFLILDEPAGGMNHRETAALIETIRAIRDRGVTVLLIEHDMSLVMEVCEELVVLENGGQIAQGPPRAIQSDPAVIEAYLGTEEA